MMVEPELEPATLAVVRKMLLGALALGVAGTGAELILLGHVESAAQWVPVIGCGLAVPLLAWHAKRASRATVTVIRVLMAAFIVSGAIGVGLHYDGNAEFERERNPRGNGWPFIRSILTGATPVLAPGSMVLLGLIGFAQVYRHPSATRGAGRDHARTAGET
jgi:hypothetical protein